jgi:hypothetical protein
LTPSKRKSPNERRGFLGHIRFAKQKSRRASAVYTELWRMSRTSGFFTILQNASPATDALENKFIAMFPSNRS